MTNMTLAPPPPPPRKYGFRIYKNGQLVREQVVEANDPALAEARVYRYLSEGEYPWYVVPRLIEEEAVVVGLPVDARDEIVNSEGEEAA